MAIIRPDSREIVAIFLSIEAKPRLCQAPSLETEVSKIAVSLASLMVFISLAALLELRLGFYYLN